MAEREPMTFRLATATREALRRIGAREARSMAWLVAKAVEEYVERDQQREQRQASTGKVRSG